MLHLCGATRIWSGSDFWTVHCFGQFLNCFVPSAYNPVLFVSKYECNAKRLWLGYLGLFAASESIPLGEGAQYIKIAKAQTELIQARIAADPDTAISKIIKQAESLETTHDPDPLRMEAKTLDQIKAEERALRQRAKRPSKKHRDSLRKHRPRICRVFGALDIGKAIAGVFCEAFPFDLECTFNAPAIVNGWSNLMENTGCHALPKDIAKESGDNLRYDRTYVVAVLNHALQAAAHAGLPATSAGYYSTLRELERNLNQRRRTRGSVALDASHATACTAFEVFICADRILYESMRTFAKQLAEDFPDISTARVIRSADELLALCDNTHGGNA